MELLPGTKLGPYEIVSPIGAGGMGEVFKARDTRLDRTVAVKVMPKHIAAREDLRARFEREARTVSSLHHPNICVLHDIGKQDGADFMVLEFLEGETLAARTARGPMPLGQVLTYGIQIADALDRAHRSGVSHRDVKPANVMITRDGCKVLDFGLAKTAQKAGPPRDSTITAALTSEGAIIGTPQYMAPEQYEGKEADGRSDIFAFGCVLYEMVTGRRCFEGKTNATLLAAVLSADPPPMGDSQPITPVSLERLVKRCIEKDPENRYQSMRDAVLDLKCVEQTASLPAQAAGLSWNKWLALAAGVLASALAVLALIHFRETPPAEPVLQMTISTPENSSPRFASISPDGRFLLVSLSGQLNLRSLDSAQFHPIANTEGANNAFWSADGKSIGFIVRGKLKTIPATGGSPQTLCDTNSFSFGSWSRNGVILYPGAGGQISRVNAAGGACTPVTKPESGEYHSFPTFLADGRHFVYFVRSSDESKRGIYIAALEDPAGRRLLSDWSGVVYAPKRTGSPYPHLLFLRGATLMAQPFDERSLQLAGDPLPVVEGISAVANPPQPEVFASSGGMLAFVANKTGQARLAWLDRSGKDLGPVGSAGTQITSSLAFSRDGKNVAITRTRDGQESVWLRNFARDSESRLTEPGTNPVWSPDASRLVYTKGSDLVLLDADGGGAETPLLHNAHQKRASDWSRDGRFLLYTESSKTGSDIWYLEDPLGKAGGKPVHFQGTNGLVKSQAQFSPDGHWVAYTSNESGGTEVYIRSFPSGSGQRRVSTGGGAQPRWSSDGKEIYYIMAGRSQSMMAAGIRPGSSGALEIGVPQELFEARLGAIFAQFNVFSYAVAPDGRFLVNVSTDVGQPAIEIITNWEKLAAGGKTQ